MSDRCLIPLPVISIFLFLPYLIFSLSLLSASYSSGIKKCHTQCEIILFPFFFSFVLCYSVPALRPRLTHPSRCCSSLYRSHSYVELKTLSPCHPWMPVASRWSVLSARIHKWTDKGWREEEMKQKAVIGRPVIPVFSSACLSRHQKR